MDYYYYGKTPNLIGPIMKSTVSKIVKAPVVNNTVSDKITSYISDFYETYIVENKIVIIIMLIIIGFLVYRYYNVSSKSITKTKNIDNKNQNINNEQNNLLTEIQNFQQKNNEINQKISELDQLKQELIDLKINEQKDVLDTNKQIPQYNFMEQYNSLYPNATTIADLQNANIRISDSYLGPNQNDYFMNTFN